MWSLISTSRIVPRPGPAILEPEPAISIIWRRVNGRWDFFCRSPQYDTARIIAWDKAQTGLGENDYQVTRG